MNFVFQILGELLSPEHVVDLVSDGASWLPPVITSTETQTDVEAPHTCPRLPPKPYQKTRRNQTPKSWVPSVDKEVQCELLKAPRLKFSSIACVDDQPPTSAEEEDCTDDENDCDDLHDPEYIPDGDYNETENDESDNDESDNDDDGTTVELSDSKSVQEQLKILVFEESLVELLSECRTCDKKCAVVISRRKGLMVVTTSTCSAGHVYTWSSQPSNSQLPCGNLHLSAAILFSGSNASQVLTLLDHFHVPRLSLSTFHRIQRSYLVPSAMMQWQIEQNMLVNTAPDTPIVLGGDGRCDSPGHSAKYGSYSLMDLERCQIMDLQLVQVSYPTLRLFGYNEREVCQID